MSPDPDGERIARLEASAAAVDRNVGRIENKLDEALHKLSGIEMSMNRHRGVEGYRSVDRRRGPYDRGWTSRCSSLDVVRALRDLLSHTVLRIFHSIEVAMTPLHVVTAIANPIRWDSRMHLYRQFEQHMLDSGVVLTIVECAYGDRPFELTSNPHVNHVPVRAKTLIWNKENLLNLGFARLPQDWRHVAWIDADVTFRKSGWASETVHALQQYDVVQPWSDCYDLGPHDDHLTVHRSFCRLVHDGKPIVPSGASGYEFAHPGYAWAATRRALTLVGGLIETAALGAGDHHMALALTGRVHESVPGGVTAGYLRPLLRWQDRATRHIAQNIGYVPGTIEHGWHGPKDKRAYVDRWAILTRNGFDPDTDLVRNTWGVFELAGNKPRLRQDIDRYFRARDEDSNTI